MPRLVDLLEYLNQPAAEHAWLPPDIKTADNSTELLTAIAKAIALVPTTKRPWTERIMLGPRGVSSNNRIVVSWLYCLIDQDADWVAECLRLLPGFPVTLIAFSPDYAEAMLPIPNLNFNLFNYSFATSRGSNFLNRAKEQHRAVFSWSDDSDEWMSLSIRNQVDGAITNDPLRFTKPCAQWDLEEVRDRTSRSTLKETILWVIIKLWSS